MQARFGQCKPPAAARVMATTIIKESGISQQNTRVRYTPAKTMASVISPSRMAPRKEFHGEPPEFFDFKLKPEEQSDPTEQKSAQGRQTFLRFRVHEV